MEQNKLEAKLLVVDDEPNIRELLATSLKFAGFKVFTAKNGQEAIEIATKQKPDIALLDIMLPDMSGITVTKKLRESNIQFPIMFLTAKDSVEDKIAGLTVGGDDYITKPFSLEEVVARIRAIIRRTNNEKNTKSIIKIADVELNEDIHEVTRGGEIIDLSPTEFKLLRYFMLNPNRVLSKSQILDHVWEYDFNGDSSIVESYISYLRRKIDHDKTKPLLIQTKRSFGYMIRSLEK